MYASKVGGKYYADSPNMFGKYPQFSQYIAEFAHQAQGHGLDVGAGPDGPNSQFFTKCQQLDGCDIQEGVVNSFPSAYSKKFVYTLGNEELPYQKQSLDFVVCSCVFHHLNNETQLINGINQMCRVLKKGGNMFLIYKAGNHNTQLTHQHSIYNQYRTVRVFGKEEVTSILKDNKMNIFSEQILGDINWVPYVAIKATKI